MKEEKLISPEGFNPQLCLPGSAPTFGSLGVLDGLHSLVHHTVVGRHHQDDDVGGISSTSSHGGEGRMTRCVQEGDLLTCRQLDWEQIKQHRLITNQV